MTDFVYDEECYPNIWTCGVFNVDTQESFNFEISHRRNDAHALANFVYSLRGNTPYPKYTEYLPTPHRMVGFNNVGYDYPLLHMVVTNPSWVTCESLYEKSASMFSNDDRFANRIWESEHIATQIDLYLIHHFDNESKRTRLKDLEINMGLENVVDLPFEPGSILTPDHMDQLIAYQFNDIYATYRFYLETLKMIRARELLSARFNKNMLNFNDTKIGKSRFIDILEESSPGICFDRSTGKKVMRQTYRSRMDVKDIIFPYIEFERPELQRLKSHLMNQTITDTRAGFDDASVNIKGFTFDFGMGGLHGSVSSRIIRSTMTRGIYDIDVKSFYPEVMIANKLYPEHLGAGFTPILAGIRNERFNYKRDDPEYGMYKLAMNGSYGDTNNIYSPLYDPLVTMRTTINGQLLLALLAEKLMAIHSLEIIQANTDGLTFAVDRKFKRFAESICNWWQKFTCLELEWAEYSMMAIRDVNNYFAQYTDGKMKHKGDYAYKLEWHKDHSHKIVAKTAEAVILHGADLREYITSPERDMLDFMGKAKVPRSSYLLSNYDGRKYREQPVTRYYISRRGCSLIKSMPPLPKVLTVNPDAPRREIGVAPTTDWNCTIANRLPTEKVFRENVNYLFYIDRAEKLVNPLLASVCASVDKLVS